MKQNPEEVKVPEGYIVTPNIGAHKLYLTELNWNDARKACLKDGGIFYFT
jgi:hypothetical protein